MNSFLLMHQNREVAKISIAKDVNGNGYLHVDRVIDEFELPYGVKSADEMEIDDLLTRWNDSRTIPLGRPNYTKILESLGAKNNSELVPMCFMCSLTDCYWFKPEGLNLTWSNVNFRDNGFNSNLYKHLFFDDHNEPINNLHSPDLTTDGALPKIWEQYCGDFYLLKSSLGNMPMDVYNEIIANAVFEQLGIEHVEYTLRNLETCNASACKCFIESNDLEFVPAENLLLDGYYRSTADYLETMKSFGYQDSVNAMILGDMIIGNVDRHARNYGQIVDAQTQNIVRLAPIFDHGGCDLIHDISFQNYKPTQTTFAKTLEGLDKETLALVKNIDTKAIAELVNNLPIDDSRKRTIMHNLNARIEKVLELERGQEYDFGREQ